MTMIDAEQEKRRLAEFYSHQTDGELEQVADHADELTDVAREALRAELVKRGFSVEQLERAGESDHSEPEFRDLVTIRSFWGLLEAELAKGLLDAAGIECFLFDGNMVRLDWFNANALGGVKLRVDPGSVEAANRVLDECVSDGPLSDEPDSDL
jgi:hypothetical protein